MKVQIITTTILNGQKTQLKENIKNDDLRLEMLKDLNSTFNSWRILDYLFDYECEQTKYGYRVVKTIRQHTETKETTITQFYYD